MKWEYHHLFRHESESKDFVDSEFLNKKGKEGWDLISVVAVKKYIDKPNAGNFVDGKPMKIETIEWHYYFKRPFHEPIKQDK